MNRTDVQNALAIELCSVNSIQECSEFSKGKCRKHGECRIDEKTNEQLEYIISENDKCVYLEACAGSGKTEVLGMKAAYEIRKWRKKDSGIAVLTFTNEATDTIKDRIALFHPDYLPSTHYIGTFSSFVHGYIAQKFGYAFFRKECQERERSFSIIDAGVKPYSNYWLDSYTLEFPVPQKRPKIYANQLFFRASDKEWFIQLDDNNLWLHDYYNYPEMQATIDSIRQQKKRDFLFKYEYLLEKVMACKKKFWNSGFATFQDMNIIARKCLKHVDTQKLLSKKFPLIMVDECQDLSFIELEILGSLRAAGSAVHFIGDLNQAIYSFKDADPEFLKRQIAEAGFRVCHLSKNFRSTQKIVNVACALQGIEHKIVGGRSSLCDGRDAFYCEYDNEQDAIRYFQRLIEEYGILPAQSAVLVRTTNLKTKINNRVSSDIEKHILLNATQLWRRVNPEDRIHALQLMGLQMQKWLKTHGRKDSYCPTSLCKSVFLWRLVLRDILNDLAEHEGLYSISKSTYSKWYSSARSVVAGIIDKHIQPVLGLCLSEVGGLSLRAPSGTASKDVHSLVEDNTKALRAETIHSVKGKSYDAVMLLSTPNASGKTGYWENWLDNKGETTRFAYVACTRPRFLLCWAVKKLSNEQRDKIETIGLTRLVID